MLVPINLASIDTLLNKVRIAFSVFHGRLNCLQLYSKFLNIFLFLFMINVY